MCVRQKTRPDINTPFYVGTILITKKDVTRMYVLYPTRATVFTLDARSRRRSAAAPTPCYYWGSAIALRWHSYAEYIAECSARVIYFTAGHDDLFSIGLTD